MEVGVRQRKEIWKFMSESFTFKCKMCGGDIKVEANASYGTCDSCGTTSTLPKANDGRIVNLFNRANHFRRLNEFDKALGAYENIISEDNANAEAHWCAALCRYGVAYVEDPKTGRLVPTCHRTQYASILSDADYLDAVAYASDGYTKRLYEEEAGKIDEIQRGILAISKKEEPYDIFICCKEETEGGSRTQESVIAQDIYTRMSSEGHRVFYARITLEDKLGQEYEPYIFNALNSAKIMLVVGTRKEHFEAVWVKNEWSRFLALVQNDRERLLIPCYRDMDPYDLPEELSVLQALDMQNVGFLQDLAHSVSKVLVADKAKRTAAGQGLGNEGRGEINAYEKRGKIFLEDEEWEQADLYFDKVLDIEPEYASAYVGKLCAQLHACTMEDLADAGQPLESSKHYKNALRFGDGPLREKLEALNRKTRGRLFYAEACNRLAEKCYEEAEAVFNSFYDYRDAGELAKRCVMLQEERDRKREEYRRMAAKVTVYEGCLIVNKPDGSLAFYMPEQFRDSLCKKCASIYQEMSGWRDIVAVDGLMGLKADGTVVTAGDTDVSGWKDIVAISGTMGLKKDGTVVTCLDSLAEPVSGWKDVVAVSAGRDANVTGLKADGTVLMEAELSRDELRDYEYSEESRAAAAKMIGRRFLVLHTNGKVYNPPNWRTREWRDIAWIGGRSDVVWGIRTDGTVAISALRGALESYAEAMEDIVAVEASVIRMGSRDEVLYGIRTDGTAVIMERDGTGIYMSRLKEYTLQEIVRDRMEYEERERQREEWRRQGLCEECGGPLTGIFKRCKACSKQVFAEISSDLRSDLRSGFSDIIKDFTSSFK